MRSNITHWDPAPPTGATNTFIRPNDSDTSLIIIGTSKAPDRNKPGSPKYFFKSLTVPKRFIPAGCVCVAAYSYTTKKYMEVSL